MKVKDIASAIEAFAPKSLKETWDNPGLQVGNPEMEVAGVIICLDVTEEIVKEARKRDCNMIVSHHPLLFHGLKNITGATPEQRMVIEALRSDIAIYSAHTNLDSAIEGVSYEMARMLGLNDIRVLMPRDEDSRTGLGIIGNIQPVPVLEFLRMLKTVFDVGVVRYSSQSPQLVVRKVALCGGSGAGFIEAAVAENADVMVTGDIKYHDFTTWGSRILLADIGHFESELCTEKIFARLLHEKFPDLRYYVSKTETNPIAVC